MAATDGTFIGALLVMTAFSAYLLFPLLVESCRRQLRRSRRKRRLSDNTDMERTSLRRWHLMKIRDRGIPVISPMLDRWLRDDRGYMRSIREQLPGALRGLGASLSSGQSVQQAFTYIAGSTPAPLSEELLRVVWDMDAGKDFSEGLAALSKRLPIPEVSFLCTAFSVQQRTGGNIQDVLDAASRSLQDSFDLERELQVQTAQAKLSAKVVGITPFILLGVLLVITPSYITSFFGSPVGFAVFIVATTLDLVGFFCVRRIVSVGQ